MYLNSILSNTLVKIFLFYFSYRNNCVFHFDYLINRFLFITSGDFILKINFYSIIKDEFTSYIIAEINSQQVVLFVLVISEVALCILKKSLITLFLISSEVVELLISIHSNLIIVISLQNEKNLHLRKNI